ncbi:MAG: acyl-protein synthetase [Oscillospiraceae bacterium]|nr:acyl-protein synthetase [Oscillospiraceae bacterium]
MVDYGEILNIPPYSMQREEKHSFLTDILKELSLFHYDNCPEYKRVIDGLGVKLSDITSFCDIPFLPVRLFKEYDLRSVGGENITKTMTSSGTTGQQVSRIYLDKETSANQTKALTKIVGSYIGSTRLPMIILDTSAVVKDRKMFSARGAGILGFQMFGRDKIYALDEAMKLDIEGLSAFLEKHSGEKILLFGFTFMIWQHFYEELKKSGYRPDLSNGILIHGGGWKKLADKKVSQEEFKCLLNEVCGIQQVYDYYGMVEQTGTIYMECECGHLHASIFSDVIVRRPHDFSVCGYGEKGLVEVVSILPASYPGHALLTEDEGVILGEDDCPCGRKGKYFSILGRIKNAEIRGCSDTYADKFR